MFKKLVFFTCSIMVVCISAFADPVEDVKDEISAMAKPTAENKDRLRELLEHPDEDVSVKALMRLARLMWVSGELDEAEAILSISDAVQNSLSRENQIKLWFTRTEFENRRNNFVKSQEYAYKAVELAQPDFYLLPRAYFGYGNALRQQMKWLDAKKYLELAVEGYEKADDIVGLSYSLNTLGIMYTSLGDLAKSLEYQHRARLLVEQYGSDQELAATYYNIGEVYQDSGEPDKALDYYKRALELDLKLGDLYSIGYDYIGIANILYQVERYDEALQNNIKAVDPLIQVNAPRELSRVYLQQANIHAKLDNRDEQLKSLQLARKYAEDADVAVQTLSVDFSFGRYYLEQQEYQKALEMLSRSLKAAEDLSLDNRQLDAHELLAKVHQLMGQIDRAFYHLQRTRELEQKLNNEDQREKTERYKRDVNLLEEQLKVTQLEQTKAEQEKALEAQRAAKQRLYLIMAAFAIILIAAMFVLWQRRKLSLLRVKLYEEALQQKNQLLADVSHELRTPLTALHLKVEALQHNLVDDVDASYDRLIEKISDINRMISDIYQLAQSDIGALKLHHNEEDAADLILHWVDEFEELVEAKGFTWQFDNSLPDSLTASFDKDRIKQVFANLISNSIAYTNSPGTIGMTAKSDKDKLVVSIVDSAPGVDEKDIPRLFERLFRVEASRSRATGGSGLGLSICKSIIEAHGGSISATPSKLGGLCMEIKLPLTREQTND